MEVVQNVCEKDEKQLHVGSSDLHLSAARGDAEIVRTLPTSSVHVDVLDIKENTPLHQPATRNGHIDVMDLSLSTNAYGNFRNAQQRQPSIHLSSMNGHSAVAQQLLDNNADVHVTDPSNPSTPTDLNGDTALHLAFENGKLEVVERLLRNNEAVNMRNASGKTPLHIAAELGFADIVKATLDHSGDVNAVDRDSNTALHHAASNGHCTVVGVLLDQTMEMNGYRPTRLQLTDVSELSQLPIIVKVRVRHTPNRNTPDDVPVEIIDTRFKQQGTSSDLTVGQERCNSDGNLLANVTKLVNACNSAKMTALHLACQNGHTSVAEILLDNYATVDPVNQSRQTPFYLAAKNGHAEITDLLLSRGFCDFVLADAIETPLHVAVREGHTKVVAVILKHSRKDKENDNNSNEMRIMKRSDLIRSNGRCVSANVVLAEKRKPLEIWKFSYEHLAIQLAILTIQPKMVQLLLNTDHCPYSEMHLRRSFHCLIETVLDHKINDCKNCSENANCCDEQQDMNCEGIKEVARSLINSTNFNANYLDMDSKAPIQDVIGYLSDESSKQIHMDHLLKLLLEKGADFNIKNSLGKTSLIMASEKGSCHVIQTLFDWEQKSGVGLNVDARDKFGATALIKAVEGRHLPVIRMLLNHNASVNLHDNGGFTALHTALFEPNSDWLDFHFFCKGLLKQNFNSLDVSSTDRPTWKNRIVEPHEVIAKLESYLEYKQEKTQLREAVVEMLLSNDKIEVNAMDFRRNTPLDVAVKSSSRITSTTFEALENRGAIKSRLLEGEDEKPIDMARIDERGRNPLHRLTISSISNSSVEELFLNEDVQDDERFSLMVYGILLRPTDFKESIVGIDDKKRTPLHYAVMSPSYYHRSIGRDLVKLFVDIGSNVNATDMYGKTPLHYAELNQYYDLLIRNGADEKTLDMYGYTPRDLDQLRDLVALNRDKARKLLYGKQTLCASTDIANLLNNSYATELSKRRVIEMIRIHSQTPRPHGSSEEAIWKMWNICEFFSLNRRLSQLKPLILQFIERLANAIKERDWRFECQPTLVGSAAEETKVVILADFDFNLQLIKFFQLCYPIPHPMGSNGYFQLRRKPSDHTEGRSDEEFDIFFNSEHCLLTYEVNFRFKTILEEVLSDPKFWKDEHLFEWYTIERNKLKSKCENPVGLFKKVLLRMLHPIEDGEGGLLFVDISIDVVACVQVEGWWSEDPLPFGIDPSVIAKGSTFVFDRPRFDSSPKNDAHLAAFSDTCARISFAPSESRIIRESSSLMRAAYIVCKMIFYNHSKTTYQLKTSLLFCMEALNARNGSEARNEEEITPQQLAFWVERIMFCFLEFSRHDVFPCYLMSSFKPRVAANTDEVLGHLRNTIEKNGEVTLSYSVFYDMYLDFCPDDTAIDIPIDEEDFSTKECFNANSNPVWHDFDREELVRLISSRIVPSCGEYACGHIQSAKNI